MFTGGPFGGHNLGMTPYLVSWPNIGVRGSMTLGVSFFGDPPPGKKKERKRLSFLFSFRTTKQGVPPKKKTDACLSQRQALTWWYASRAPVLAGAFDPFDRKGPNGPVSVERIE